MARLHPAMANASLPFGGMQSCGDIPVPLILFIRKMLKELQHAGRKL